MLNTDMIHVVKATVSRKGKKMYFYYSNGAKRWIRLKKDLAENLIVSEQVELVKE